MKSRAAHSVKKGGAAMLGEQHSADLASLRRFLQNHSKKLPGIKPGSKVETLLLRVFDTLQELLRAVARSVWFERRSVECDDG
jgi:hypothetical protein